MLGSLSFFLSLFVWGFGGGRRGGAGGGGRLLPGGPSSSPGRSKPGSQEIRQHLRSKGCRAEASGGLGTSSPQVHVLKRGIPTRAPDPDQDPQDDTMLLLIHFVIAPICVSTWKGETEVRKCTKYNRPTTIYVHLFAAKCCTSTSSHFVAAMALNE